VHNFISLYLFIMELSMVRQGNIYLGNVEELRVLEMEIKTRLYNI